MRVARVPLALVAALAAAVLLMPAPAGAVRLITDEEAALPDASGDAPRALTRAITRGPAVRLVSPDPAAGPVRSPFGLRIEFQPRGGARIDVGATRATYLKARQVDLGPRLAKGLSETGIAIADAEAPPGTHRIRIVVRDSDGRESDALVELRVAQ